MNQKLSLKMQHAAYKPLKSSCSVHSEVQLRCFCEMAKCTTINSNSVKLEDVKSREAMDREAMDVFAKKKRTEVGLIWGQKVAV